MTYKTDDSFIRYLLRREGRIRNRLSLYLMTDNEDREENLGVKTSNVGNSTENNIVKKITDKNYVFFCECLACMDKLYSELSRMEQEVWLLHFKLGWSVERVGYEVGYSRASIYNILKNIKCELKTRVLEIEKRVYRND